jgi:hypothetical protein
MATRLKKRHQDEVRTKIQASQLINVLQNCAIGVTEDLSPARLKAIEILLKKSLPDLSSTEIEGNVDAPLSINVITGIGLNKPKDE